MVYCVSQYTCLTRAFFTFKSHPFSRYTPKCTFIHAIYVQSLTLTFSQYGQQLWKLRAEIHYGPTVKHKFHFSHIIITTTTVTTGI